MRHTKFYQIFGYKMTHKSPTIRPDLVTVNAKKKENEQTIWLCCPVGHIVKISENEKNKNKKDLDLNRELKELLNMNVTGSPIVIDVLGEWDA